MIRISLPWIIEVGKALDDLDKLQPNQTVGEALYALLGAQMRIETLFHQSVYGPNLRSSRQKGSELHSEIIGTLGEFDLERKLTDLQVWSLKTKKEEFKLIFMAELGVIASFIVTRKENFDTILLIESGIGLFPQGLLDKAPETEKDAAEAGKALAFELATACGFHAFRVTESVARRYWDEVSNGKNRPKPETLGSIASELKDKKLGDIKIIESLAQLAKLHRNPLIHPEVILSVDEAIGILGISRSVIGSMMSVLPNVPLTTGASPSA